MTSRNETVPLYCNVTSDTFLQEIYPNRVPALLRGVDVGSCVDKWNTDYLCEKVGNVSVKIHVSTEPRMDFIKKNFLYKTLQFDELVKRSSREVKTEYFISPKEYYYLRSLGSDPRGREVADVQKQFPQLANDLKIPPFFNDDDFFSSVFRVASAGMQLWTHYDVMDNLLMQIRGRKRVVLYSPAEALNMYLAGDKSQVLNIDQPDAEMYPKFLQATRHDCYMEAGDILLIPALWFHNVLALSPGVAVNVFWRNLAHNFYDRHDPYGNKDPLPAAKALQHVDSATNSLTALPPEYQDFYMRRMLAKLEALINR